MQDGFHRMNIGVLSFLTLSGLIPFGLAYNLVNPRFGPAIYAAWGIVLWSSFKLSAYSVNGEKRLIAMTFWIYVYIFLGLSPMFQLMSNEFPLAGWYSTETIFIGFAMIITGLISYELGRHLSLHKFGTLFNSILAKLDKRNISTRKVFCFSLLAILVTVVLIIWSGGLQKIILPRHQRLVALMEFVQGEGQVRYQMLSTFLRVPIFVAFISLWSLRLHNSTENNNFITLRHKITLFILLALNIIVNNPVNSARYWFGAIAFSLAFITLKWRRASFAILSFSIVILFIYIFPFADIFRYETDVNFTYLFSEYRTTEMLVYKGDFDSFQQILNTVNYVKEFGLSFGRQFAGTLLFWFPRSIWQNKPIPSGRLVAEGMQYMNTNLSLPLWSEAYLDIGFLGVILVFIAYGYLTTAVENFYLERRENNLTFFPIFVPFYAAYQFFLLRGTLMSAFGYLIPVILFFFIVTGKNMLTKP